MLVYLSLLTGTNQRNLVSIGTFGLGVYMEDPALQNSSLKRFFSGTFKTNNNKPSPRSQTTAWPGWSSYVLYMLNISHSELTLTLCPGPGEKTFPNKKEQGKQNPKPKHKKQTINWNFYKRNFLWPALLCILKNSFLYGNLQKCLRKSGEKSSFMGYFILFFVCSCSRLFGKILHLQPGEVGEAQKGFWSGKCKFRLLFFPFFLFFSSPSPLSSCVCRQLSRNNKHHCLQYTSHELRWHQM